MIITNDKKLKEIQSEFQSHFPYLKIEFYDRLHKEGEGSTNKDALDNNQTILALKKMDSSAAVDVKSDMSVFDLEDSIAKKFELGAQVFRKSGNIWLQTTTTDHLTLAEQNQKAIDWVEDEKTKNDTPNAMDRMELE